MEMPSRVTMEQMTEILDNTPTAIYVTAADDYELMYANRAAKKVLGWSSFPSGAKCYELAGFSVPCPFCQVKNMRRDSLLVREFSFASAARIFQLSGKFIDWAGRLAHIEYIEDVTEKKQAAEQVAAREKDLRETVASIPCGLSVYRFDKGEISPVFHNNAFYRIMGYSVEHIRNIEHYTSFLNVHEEDLPVLQAKIQRAIAANGRTSYTYRVFNDRKGEYVWIRLDGSVKEQKDGSKLLYGVYNDVGEQLRLQSELTQTTEKMQEIVNAIPGGVAIYKISDILETKYFSDGVPALTGYTAEEYRKMTQGDASGLIYWQDRENVLAAVGGVIASNTAAELEFRKQHRDGHIVWVHAQAKQIGEENGFPLVQCVFHNISKLKETQRELDHLVNSIPGGIASFKAEDGRLTPVFVSDGVAALVGYSREEFDMLQAVYEPDRERVNAALSAALESGEAMDVSYRMRHKDGSIVWIHLNGRLMGPKADVTVFYAVFTGMSAETRLFQSIADETADGIYVIDKKTYELLYCNESKAMFSGTAHFAGQKCYETLHGNSAPCDFCTMNQYRADGEEHEIAVGGDRYYTSRFKETDWNGIPAYVQYIRDATEEVELRREKERLELYFQTVVKNLPDGISVVRCESDGSLTTEFLSDGFAALMRMTARQAEGRYKDDLFAGVHAEDAAAGRKKLQKFLSGGEGRLEMELRFLTGDGAYQWTKCTISLIQSLDGYKRLYTVYTDISDTVRAKEQFRKQYDEFIMQHYRVTEPNVLILGHCNITNNVILEIDDHTDSDLLKTFGSSREDFFRGISRLVVDEEKQKEFCNKFFNEPSIAAFHRRDTEQVMSCYVKFPKEEKGRYVQFKVNLLETPDTGDITGVLTVTDVTEQTITDRIMHHLSVTSYDYVIDLKLDEDSFSVLVYNQAAHCAPPPSGTHSARVADMAEKHVVPKDAARYRALLEPEGIKKRLSAEKGYTFSYSLIDESGDIRTKSMSVSAIDLRLGRVCLVCADITDSVREQQGLLNMIAYTFDLACFIDIATERLTMYTRETILKSLPPHVVEQYDRNMQEFISRYGTEKDMSAAVRQFRLKSMLERLRAQPAGYDYVFPYREEEEILFKQVNVLWGDLNHRTVCLVRADVTDLILSERKNKAALEKALSAAEDANRAKSDFLSSMSHDIRTPMNAITGMTALAEAHIDNKAKVSDCLRKISVSSKHLLSLINDVLDMSKLDGAKITLNRVAISLSALENQLSSIIQPQAEASGVEFVSRLENIAHEGFYGDPLRVNQILINLLSNAVKFTPAGGKVEFCIEEIASSRPNRARYRFVVRDNGIGMQKEFMAHMFSPFARSRRAADIEGTGLGLSISKRLVDLMEGSIRAESEPGKGTAFFVQLDFEVASDLKAEIVSAPLSAETEENIYRGRNFLVAEDSRINAEIICELLSMRGAKTQVAVNGVRAVQAFAASEAGTFDAIFMDIMMPEMNGYEATRAIRALNRPDAESIPVIAMTANAFAEDVHAAMEAGMNAHVAKPVDLDVLRAALEKTLSAKEG